MYTPQTTKLGYISIDKKSKFRFFFNIEEGNIHFLICLNFQGYARIRNFTTLAKTSSQIRNRYGYRYVTAVPVFFFRFYRRTNLYSASSVLSAQKRNKIVQLTEHHTCLSLLLAGRHVLIELKFHVLDDRALKNVFEPKLLLPNHLSG